MRILFKVLRHASFAVLGVCLLGTTAAQADLHPRVKSIIAKVEGHFGRRVTITSGCRSRAKNRSIGGAKASLHMRCMAADIKVEGVSERSLLRYVKAIPAVGGVGTYCRNGVVHVDIGPDRQWHEPCRRNIFKRAKRLRVARR